MSNAEYKDYYSSSLSRFIKNFDDGYSTSSSYTVSTPSYKNYKNNDDYDTSTSSYTTRSDISQNNIKNTLNIDYTNTWFETENNATLEDYIKQLFIISKNYFSPNVEIDTIKGMIVPHAGLMYSGLCAASGYFALRHRTKHIRKIILLCTNHHDQEIYTTNQQYITSFLKSRSNIEIDTTTTHELSKHIKINNTLFEQEHSFFMQLPFIESITTTCKLIPLIVGNVNITDENKLKLNKIITILSSILKEKDSVIICTSDLSHVNGHFNTIIKDNIYFGIRESDSKILNFIYNQFTENKYRTKNIDDILFMQNAPACGIFSMFLFSKILKTYNQIKKKKKSRANIDSDSDSSNTSMKSSIDKYYNIYPRLVCYYTSLQKLEINIYNFNPYQCFKTLDIPNSNDSSVSYGSIIFTTQPYISKKSRHIESLMTQFEKLALLSLAREHLYLKLAHIHIPNHLIYPISSPIFKLPLGVFCTITTDQNELRGCIGTTETNNLDNTIETNVKKFIEEAAFNDTRFNPLQPFEYNRIQLSLTILYKLKKISIGDYFKSKFKLGKDGILINYNNLIGYFLPSVATEYNYNKKELLEELCNNKIGLLSKQCYLDHNVQLYFNEGYEFSEKDFL